jgi:uncharacterized membrane protein YfcA
VPGWSEISLVELLLLAVAAAAAGVVRGFSGFGAGLIMIPAASLVVGPATAVPVVVLLEAIAGAQLLPPVARHVQWGEIAPIAVPACLMIPVGGAVLAGLDADLMQRVISVVVLIFVGFLASGWRREGPPTIPVTIGTGLTSGLFTGAAGIGGPPVILFFLTGTDRAPRTRANLLAYFAITQVVALGAFFFHGLMMWKVVWSAVLLAPVFLLAAHAGTRLFGRVSERAFRRVTLGLLTLVAVAGLV